MNSARNSLLILAVLGILLFPAAAVFADWDEGDENTKWVQMPDTTPNGIDVKVTRPLILADDWQCLDPRAVTDIHLWGSWRGDVVPDAVDPAFRIQIWSDQPAVGEEHSRPAEMLWEATDFTWTAREWYKLDPSGPGEGWYDPTEAYFEPSSDWSIWQLNVDLSKNPFRQIEGSIYWLVVQAWFPDGSNNYELGWKTSTEHWNDDAVWATGELLPGMGYQWNELVYPDGHEYQGQSMDLAFVITVPEPGTLALLLTAGLGLLLLVWKRRRK